MATSTTKIVKVSASGRKVAMSEAQIKQDLQSKNPAVVANANAFLGLSQPSNNEQKATPPTPPKPKPTPTPTKTQNVFITDPYEPYTSALYPQSSLTNITPSADNYKQTTSSTSPNVMASTSLGVITLLNQSVMSGELVIKVSILNTSNDTQEYRAYLYDANGDRIDKEPDTYFANVKPNNSRSFSLSTNWKYGDITSLGGAYRVEVITQGGIYVDSRIVYLNTGTITTPTDKHQGNLTIPDTALPIEIPTLLPTTQTNIQPVNTQQSEGILSSLFGTTTDTTNNIKNYVIIGLGAVLLYSLLKKK